MPSDSLNFRDLGGLPAEEGCIRSGVLYRSEGPRNFTPAQLETLQGMGFRSIVDLRSAREREEAPHDWHGPDCRWLGLDVNADLRVFGHDGRERLILGPEPEIAITTMAETYREVVGALLPHWPIIAGTLLDGEVPMMLNCTAGKDRTGIAAALVLTALGVPYETVRADFLLSNGAPGMNTLGGSLPSALSRLPADVTAPLIGVEGVYLDTAFAALRQDYGSVDAYLQKELGVGPRERAQLRRRMLARNSTK